MLEENKNLLQDNQKENLLKIEEKEREIKKIKSMLEKNALNAIEQNLKIKNMNIFIEFSKFEQNMKILLINKNLYYSNLKTAYLENKFELKNINVYKLISLINDLYSFKIIAIYRKIANLLSKKIIKI